MSELDMNKLYIGTCNVRKHVGELDDLKESIKSKGLLQPLVVRPVKNRYEVIIGSRRFTAAKELGLKKVSAFVRPMDDVDAISVSLVENVHRSDLELEEEAEAVLKLMKIDPKRFGNVKLVANAIGRSETGIRDLLEAYELTFKLRKHGMKVRAARAPPEKARRKAEAIPLKHTQMVARALKTEEVRKLSPELLERKVSEIVKTIAPLPEHDARRIVDRFKIYPEKTVESIADEALAKQTGISINVYFAPRVARALNQASDDRGISEEELISLAVEEWLAQKGYLKSA